jgi:hypothetical protein
MSDIAPTFQGEVQFRRWSDSSTQGVQVTFALPDSADLEPLKAKAGKRFMAVLVEIGDDEQPVMGNPISTRKDQRGPLCKEACDYCAMHEFQSWMCDEIERGRFVPPEGVDDEEAAKRYILTRCDVTSRRHLDEIPSAGDRFVTYIRIPFMRWQRERRAAR